MAVCENVRVEESLRVKIGEAKNLPSHTVSGSARNTFCVIKLDKEEVYRTSTVEKSLNPFYGEEFHGEIPRKFRYLSFYVHDKTDKILGKVSIRKKDLHKYNGKEHWFPLLPVEAHSEAQAQVHLEVRFDEYLTVDPETTSSHRMSVRVIECSDLMVTNGACNPYAVVTLSYGKSKHREDVKRTNVKKKTICPQFEEIFFFDLENRGQNHDRNNYYIEDIFNGELSISLWHDDSRVSREVLGGMFPGVFLGEVKLQLRDLDTRAVQKAWYFLGPRNDWKQNHHDIGSLRLKLSYTAEHVFDSHFYDDLRELLLKSPDVEPVSSSIASILGDVVAHRQEAAQPLVRIFLHHGKIVPFIKTLAMYEIERTSDHNTLFRGNTLLTKMIDELMKLVGLPYLHHALKGVIDQICSDHLPCEIDPARLRDGDNMEDNMDNLKEYVEQIFEAITSSGLVCPTMMCEVFFALKEAAQQHFPDNKEVKYQVVSGFVFLRYFAPAILGPRFFDLTSETQDTLVHRTLTLISKAIQGLGNLVSSKSWTYSMKEDYMVPLFQKLSDSPHIDAIKMYLDIISSSTKANYPTISQVESPIVLKEGGLIKRAQGRKKFGVKNFKRRYFCLTNQSLSYYKNKGEDPLCVIPIEDILAVERLQEESFKMKYMFQVIQPSRALYVQASNCIEEKEWLDILTKVSNSNRNRLKQFHPAAFINGHWLCCKATDHSSEGCTPVSRGLPVTEINVDIDSDREVEKVHSLLLANMDKLEAMQEAIRKSDDDACGVLEVYSGERRSSQDFLQIEDTKTCFESLNKILECIISLEQEHLQYRKMMQKQRVKGSFETPIGDDGFVAGNETGTRL